MRTAVFAAAAISLAVTQPVAACIAGLESEETPPAPPTYIGTLKSHFDVGYWQVQVQDRLKKANKIWDPDAEVDLAAALAHAQEYDKSLQHLHAAERSRPGMYTTAVNLGTVYELKGNVPHALEWIKAGIQRDPLSHHATEWLHIRILEAKVQLAKDPRWLETHSVLGMDFGTGNEPTAPTNLPPGNQGKKNSLKHIEQAVNYQLHERLEFVESPDPVVADLLTDLGNMLVLRGQDDDAREIWKLAVEYGPERSSMAQARLNWLDDVRDYRPLKMLLGFGLICCIGYWYKTCQRYQPTRVQPWDGPEPPPTWKVGK